MRSHAGLVLLAFALLPAGPVSARSGEDLPAADALLEPEARSSPRPSSAPQPAVSLVVPLAGSLSTSLESGFIEPIFTPVQRPPTTLAPSTPVALTPTKLVQRMSLLSRALLHQRTAALRGTSTAQPAEADYVVHALSVFSQQLAGLRRSLLEDPRKGHSSDEVAELARMADTIRERWALSGSGSTTERVLWADVMRTLDTLAQTVGAPHMTAQLKEL